MEIVGIPREYKTGEKRVGLTPEGVRQLTRRGIRVLVEAGAGALSGFPDSGYERAGALIVSTPHRLWKGATLIKKVKEPEPQEFAFFHPKHTLFTFLHLASQENCDLVRQLMSSGLTALAYETVEKDGEALILTPMSEIAGILAAYFGGIVKHLIEVKDGEIYYHSWYPKVLERAIQGYPEPIHGSNPGNVLVLGGGHAGEKAAEMSALMGGKVTVIELSKEKREILVAGFMKKKLWINVISPDEAWLPVLQDSDVVIGAVHVHGKRAPVIVTEAMLREASTKKRRVVIDVAVDQGGNISGTRGTTLDNPLYADNFGNIRFGVTNIPSLAGHAASLELEKVTLDYTLALAEDMQSAFKKFPELEKGLNIQRGRLVHEAVASAYRIGIGGGLKG